MYINIGGNVSVRSREIIGVFDLDNSTYEKGTREFLSDAEKKGEVLPINEEELPRSFILTEQKGKKTVYLSQKSPSAIGKRMI